MEKKDILEKAREENKYADERYRQIYLQSAQIGMSVGELQSAEYDMPGMIQQRKQNKKKMDSSIFF